MTPEVKEAYGILLSEKGRVLLDHWAAKFGFQNRTTVVANDPISTAFNEGQRVVWCFLMRELAEALKPGEPPATAVATETEDDNRN